MLQVKQTMGIVDEFIASGVSGIFGDILGLICAIGSMLGVLLVFYGIIRMVLKISGFIQVKTYGTGALILGIVLVLVFGWSFGLEYFEVWPM